MRLTRWYNGDAMAIRKPARRKTAKAAVKRQPQHEASVFERLAAIGREVPAKDWDKLPRDAAKNFDHYAHGSPREV